MLACQDSEAEGASTEGGANTTRCSRASVESSRMSKMRFGSHACSEALLRDSLVAAIR
jgi:hypothetical protein